MNPAGAQVCGSCGDALSSSPAAAATDTLPAGTKLQGGKYTLGKVLGRGGLNIGVSVIDVNCLDANFVVNTLDIIHGNCY